MYLIKYFTILRVFAGCPPMEQWVKASDTRTGDHGFSPLNTPKFPRTTKLHQAGGRRRPRQWKEPDEWRLTPPHQSGMRQCGEVRLKPLWKTTEKEGLYSPWVRMTHGG